MKRPLLMVAFLTLRLRSDFSSDKVDASNAAFRCRWGRLEMQQVGVDSNHLRAQPRCPPYLDELKSSGRPACLKRAHFRTSHQIRHGGRRAKFKFQALSRLRASASAAALGNSVESRSVSVKSAPARLALDRSAPARSA